MEILHSQPTGIAFSGATYLTGTGALTDSKPAKATRIEFDGVSTTDFVSVTSVWQTPTVIRGMHVIFQGGIPSGARAEAAGKRLADPGYDYDLGGNSLTAETVERPDGTVMVTFLFDGADPIVGIDLTIYNDANGAAFATGYIDIGEIFIGQGYSCCIRPTLSIGLIDPTVEDYTLGNQPHIVRRKEADTVSVEVSPQSFNNAFMAEQSLKWLRARLVGRQDCVVIFATRPPHTGRAPIDYDVVNQVATFGKCTNIGELRANPDGNNWSMNLTFRESPGRIVA